MDSNKILKTTTMEKNNCPEFPYFGARYPDARCIEGFLWDLDSYEEDGFLHSGGEIPCPFCNREGYIEMRLDDVSEHVQMSSWDEKNDVSTISEEDAKSIAIKRINEGIEKLYEKYRINLE